MKESFDKALSHKIAQAFEQHQEAYRPEDWQRLKTKMQKPKPSRWTWLRRGLGALVLFIPVSLAVYMGVNSIVSQGNFTKTNTPESPVSEPITPYLSSFAPLESSETTSISNQDEPPTPPKQDKEINSSPHFEHNQQAIFDKTSETKENTKRLLTKPNFNQPKVKINSLTPTSSTTIEPVLALSELIIHRASPQQDPEKQTKASRLSVGFGASAGLLQARDLNTESSAFWSAGLETRLRLSPNWYVRSGINLQSYHINAVPIVDPSFQLLKTANNRELISSQWNLIGMEIPLGLEYRLALKKGKALRFGAGISSIIQLNESGTSRFRQTYYNLEASGPVSFLFTPKSDEVEESYQESFGGANFASFINLSFTYEQNLGQKLRLGVTPFWQKGLQGLGKQDLEINNQGLRLQLYWQK